jgi:hypothetical protein
MVKTNLSIPQHSIIAKSLPVIHYSDSFSGICDKRNDISLETCVSCFLFGWPAWIRFLFWFRDILVKPFGLRGASKDDKELNRFREIKIFKGARVGFFIAIDFNDNEVVLYASDKHLDACASVLITRYVNFCEIDITTIVKFHNTLGRVYFFVIKPFHKLIIKSKLKTVIKNLN